MAMNSTLLLAAGQTEAPNFTVSTDGSQVIEVKTRTAWARCVEGMQWNGQTCAGTPVLATHAEALALANARSKADGLRWRVPRVKELQRIAAESAHAPKAAESLFPGSPKDWHWTVTAKVDSTPVNQYDYRNIERGITEHNASHLAVLHGWGVKMQTGEARGDILKKTKLPVRLVRQEK
jgi:hypothetical protein